MLSDIQDRELLPSCLGPRARPKTDDGQMFFVALRRSANATWANLDQLPGLSPTADWKKKPKPILPLPIAAS